MSGSPQHPSASRKGLAHSGPPMSTCWVTARQEAQTMASEGALPSDLPLPAACPPVCSPSQAPTTTDRTLKTPTATCPGASRPSKCWSQQVQFGKKAADLVTTE